MDRLAFLLVETEKDLAGGVCDRIRAQFDAIRNGVSEGLQVGIGHASFPDDGGTVTALLQVAEARALADMSLPRAPRIPAHVLGEAVGKGNSSGGTNGTGPGAARSGGEEGKPAGLPGWETDGEAKAAPAGAATATTEGLPAVAERRQRWAEASDKTLAPGSAASVKRWFQK
jgi:hypothetical protein